MDFFQGSSPPNFISFCLENQNIDESQIRNTTSSDNFTEIPRRPIPITMPRSSPDPIAPSSPTSSTTIVMSTAAVTEGAQDTVTPSPFSVDSDFDVTAYADEKVLLLARAQEQEERQIAKSSEIGEQEVEESAPEGSPTVGNEPQTSTLLFQTSTPTKNLSSESAGLDLSQLEAGLTIAPSTQTELPELLTTYGTSANMSAASFLQHETDEGSSVCDAPKLPTGVTDVVYLDDVTGTEEAGDTSSQASGPALYSFQPVGNVAETAGESSVDTPIHRPDNMRPSTSTSAGQDSGVRELSGRSRAILKQYFDQDATTINFPLGHRTVAFTEPQVYHLLRVLTDETLKMSFTAMEQMVIGAVRGAPVTSSSRTDHFRIRPRAQTPGPGLHSDSDGSLRSENFPESGTDTSVGTSSGQEDRGLDSSNDTDSSGEMALISQAFKEPFRPASTSCGTTQNDPSQAGFESAEQSSLDATLSELRTQTSPTPPLVSSSGKAPRRKQRKQTRGVPMKEEFFSKIGWTRSFISGPADPLHNPYMVWCHICKKNISVKTKGTLEILRHHRTEKHLRRDQRWRYEHLKSVHPVSGKVQHRVRGRNGKILSEIELAKEMRHFMHVELVDIGERFPFYDDFIKGTTTTLVTPEARTKTQIQLIGNFIQQLGDVGMLRKLWSQIGSLTNYQTSYCDFDWGEERISVSSLLGLRTARGKPKSSTHFVILLFFFRPSSSIFSLVQ